MALGKRRQGETVKVQVREGVIRTRAGLGATLLIAAGLVSLIGVRSADAKPAGKSITPPDTLTLKVRWEAMPPMAEPMPGAIEEGHAFYGTLKSARPACRTGRNVLARYEFPPDGEPLIRPMWGGGDGPIKTDGKGAWAAKPVVFARQAYRVTAFVKARRLNAKLVCPQVESRSLAIPAQFPPGELARFDSGDASSSRASATVVTIGLKYLSVPSGEPTAAVFVKVKSRFALCRKHRPFVLLTDIEHHGADHGAAEERLETDAAGYWQTPITWAEPALAPILQAIRDGMLLIKAKAPRLRLNGGHVCAAGSSGYLSAPN